MLRLSVSVSPGEKFYYFVFTLKQSFKILYISWCSFAVFIVHCSKYQFVVFYVVCHKMSNMNGFEQEPMKEMWTQGKIIYWEPFFSMQQSLKIKQHPEKCFVESTKISIDPYLNEKLC